MSDKLLTEVQAHIIARAEWWRANPKDPHGINTAVYVAILEVAKAIESTMAAKAWLRDVEAKEKLAPVATAADAAPVPTPSTMWYPLFQHMSDVYQITMTDSELYEIALKVDQSRAAAQPAPVPATALTREQAALLRSVDRIRDSWAFEDGGYAATLVGKGFLEMIVDGGGWMRITEAGRRALREQEKTI